jgi:mannose-6-phosphate isomerase-like protein (cupin superfamily)
MRRWPIHLASTLIWQLAGYSSISVTRENPMTEHAQQKLQDFIYSHLTENSFFADGHRQYFDYRDFGMAKATRGLLQAHVVRANSPSKPGGLGWHKHVLDLQFVYVLKGWQTMEIEGHGTVTMREGSAWIQPPSILHNVIAYSDDFEALELICPAQYDTIDGI